VARGDTLAELYRSYGHLVVRRCRSILRDEAEAKDAMQDVFVRAMRYPRSVAQADSKLQWLYRTAERCCFDRLRRRGRETPVTPDDLARVAQCGISQSAGEAREVILAFLDRFEPKVQQVAVLYYLDELPQEEIAQQLGWSRRTVGKKLALVRSRAKALAKMLLAEPAGGSL
jgi:RNA polymerase sigma-70 factor (ECF subfamily)